MKKYWLFAIALISILTTAQAQPAAGADSTGGFEWGPGLKVLIVAGGFGHDFNTWDNKFDTDLLGKAGITSVHYTEDPTVAARELPHADVLLVSNNHMGFDTPPFRQAVTNFIASDKGIVMLHSATFYAWKWVEWYSNYVGAGARGHDGASPFTEVILKDHPVTHGLPPSFAVTDELYHIEPFQGGSPMEILGEAVRGDGQKYPSIWLVPSAGKARVICIALGHDGFPRQSPEFLTLLTNAVKWAGHQ